MESGSGVADPAYLLDTNLLIYLLADQSAILRRRVEQCEPGSLVTSTLCVAEAAYGLARIRGLLQRSTGSCR